MNERKLKNNKGITLISLIITIAVMFIVAGTTVYISLDRFEINRLKKMYNDIELLSDKVANYYLKYNGLPVIKDSENNAIEYTYTPLNFDKNINDSGSYYILDLEAMEGISLNYGKEGYNNPNTSDDVYIINKASHVIYYVKGIELDGEMYYTIPKDENSISDTIPPTKPEIKVVSGDKTIDENNYETNVTLEFVSGKDNWSDVNRTTYSINGSSEQDISNLENNIYPINEKGTYEIKLRTYDNNNMFSEEIRTIYVGKIKLLEYLESTGTQYINTEIPTTKDYVIKTKTSATKETAYNTICGNGSDFELYFDTNLEVRTWKNISILSDSGNIGVNEIHNVESKITTNSTTKILLFAYNGNGSYPLYGRIYSFTIEDSNGNIIMNLIPVIRNDTSEACMYDTIGKKFYCNKGTGTFGTSLNDYTKVEYLESTGTQYIDTGIPTTKDYVIKTKTSATKASEYNTICGNGSDFELYFDTNLEVRTWKNISILSDSGNIGVNEIHNVESKITTNSTTKILLFAYNGIGHYPLYGRIYSFTIEDGNGNIIMNLIPVIRNDTSEACMYDTIGKKFYYNKRTDTFKTNLDE